jgi:hypothetical protein
MPRWPPLLRVAFRYSAAFFAITTTYLAIGHAESIVGIVFPFVTPITEWVQYGPAGLMTGYEWATHQLFGPGVVYSTIAGYRAYLITALALAGAVTVVWSFIDRNRPDYRRAHGWLRIYLRYLLAAVMLGYGMAKVIPGQFPPPSLVQLITPLGEFTRMRVLWLSMGAAPPYIVFTGLCEVSGALLLFSRRTTTLGALILAASLTNVLALNLSYGIGVQLNVTVYLLMALVLLVPDARRLIEVVLPAQDSRGTQPVPPATRSRVAQATAIAKWVVVMCMIAAYVHTGYEGRAGAFAKPALYGIYDVEDFVRGGVALPLGDDSRWKRFVVAEYDTAGIQNAAGAVVRYDMRVDVLTHTLTLTPRDRAGEGLELHYSQEADGRLVVEGTVHGDAVRARLRATDITKFTLRQPLR